MNHEIDITKIQTVIIQRDSTGKIVKTNKRLDSSVWNVEKVARDIYYNQMTDQFLQKRISQVNENNEIFTVEEYQDISLLYKTILSYERKLEDLRIDPLTKLGNRRALEDELEKIQGLNCPYIIAMCDIDEFKHINDTMGHSLGDSVLKKIALLLKQRVRNVDFVGRYGGDEFIFTFQTKEFDGILSKLYVLEEEVKKLYNAEGLGISLSIGVAPYEPGNNIQEVIKKADEALYFVKNNGRDNIGFLDRRTGNYVQVKRSNAPKQNNVQG